MSSDLNIVAAPSLAAGNEAVAAARPPVAAAVPAVQVTGVPSTANPTPNPTLELDAALGLVVIQFHSDSGAVTSSIPSQQQIDAYRLWQETRIGPAPNIGGGVALPAGVASKA